MQIRLTFLGIVLYSSSFLVARFFSDVPKKQVQVMRTEKLINSGQNKTIPHSIFLASLTPSAHN
jgi:hypothetical protein